MGARMGLHKDLEKVRIADSAHLEDTQIVAAIADVLTRKAPVPLDTVGATFAAGRVTLMGKVERWSLRDVIERALLGIHGIELTNLVTVEPEAISREVERAIVEARSSPW
jgi:hypothetical protein